MFIQVIEGQVADAAQVHAALDRWTRELAPGAAGWLGSTEGVTDDGHFVALARFESAEAARRNSERPEQDEWWTQTAKLFTGEVTFRDSTDVIVHLHGDPDSAEFVQVMRSSVSDSARVRQLMEERPEEWAAFRPEVLGDVVAMHDGGDFTMAVYFTTEEAAREGERKELPPELAALTAQLDQLTVSGPRFWDLRNPWLSSP